MPCFKPLALIFQNSSWPQWQWLFPQHCKCFENKKQKPFPTKYITMLNPIFFIHIIKISNTTYKIPAIDQNDYEHCYMWILSHSIIQTIKFKNYVYSYFYVFELIHSNSSLSCSEDQRRLPVLREMSIDSEVRQRQAQGLLYYFLLLLFRQVTKLLEVSVFSYKQGYHPLPLLVSSKWTNVEATSVPGRGCCSINRKKSAQ